MGRGNEFYGFEFYDDLVVYYEVGAEGGAYEDVFVNCFDGLLAGEGDAFVFQFDGHGGFVDRFEEAGSEGRVDFVGGVDYCAGYGVGRHLRVISDGLGESFRVGKGTDFSQRTQRFRRERRENLFGRGGVSYGTVGPRGWMRGALGCGKGTDFSQRRRGPQRDAEKTFWGFGGVAIGTVGSRGWMGGALGCGKGTDFSQRRRGPQKDAEKTFWG